MGGSNSTVKNVIELDTYMKDSETTQRLVASAFNKCVVNAEGSDDVFTTAELSDSERRCVQEYVAMYSMYCRGAYRKFMELYNQQQQEMMERQQAMMGGGGGGGHQ